MERRLAPPRVERRAPRARDCIEVVVPNKGPHPAVVLRVEPGMIVVAVCSTTLIPEVEVPGTMVDRDLVLSQMRLRLGDVTRFYECYIQPMEWAGNEYEIRGRCLGGRFDKLFRTMEKVARESLAGKRTITPIPRHAKSLVKQLEQLIPKASPEESIAMGPGNSSTDPNLEAPPKPSHDS